MKKFFLLLAAVAGLMSVQAQQHIEFKWHRMYGVAGFDFSTNINTLTYEDKATFADFFAIGGWQIRKESGIGLGVEYKMDLAGGYSQLPVFVGKQLFTAAAGVMSADTRFKTGSGYFFNKNKIVHVRFFRIRICIRTVVGIGVRVSIGVCVGVVVGIGVRICSGSRFFRCVRAVGSPRIISSCQNKGD